jgi:hypothetical protein
MSKVFEVSSVVPTQKDIINETKNQYNNLKLQTNRYKFANEVTDMLSDFAKLHQYDGSKDYKEAWNNWIKEEEVGNKLEDEKSRLIKMGMTDDVMSRLYKSSRYYYRKKSNNLNVEPKERKKYVGFPTDILRTMDAQIIREITGSIDVIENDKIVSRFTPANSFELYLKENPESVNDLLSESSGSAEERRIETTAAVNRLKKTYKNRFYKIKVQIEEEDTK